MLVEADLFVRAEQMLVEVLGRIRPDDRDLVLPEMWRGAGGWSLERAVAELVRDDAAVPGLLGAEPVPVADLRAGAAAACAAAVAVEDGELPVRTSGGDLPAREFLLRATVARSLLAHYVAARLGSTACPLPEELARPLWELTWPSAAAWRELGYFREPMPLPPYVSWRDRFVLCAGHEPHPYGH